jgi:REP element-mobilizing transposase RayT
MATPKKSPVKSAKKSPVKSPKGKTPVKSPKASPKKSPTPAKSPKVAKVIAKKEKKGKATKVVDPNKPKRAPSAYFIWMGENRAKVIAEHKLDASKVTEVMKKMGELWSKMTDAQKKPFEDKAAKAKEQYEKDMAAYEPDESQFITKKGTKAAKDPNAPKKASTAYFIFMGENRAKIIAEHTLDSSKVAEVAKKAGEIWGTMTDAQKAPFTAKAEKDKARYAQEMAARGA